MLHALQSSPRGQAEASLQLGPHPCLAFSLLPSLTKAPSRRPGPRPRQTCERREGFYTQSSEPPFCLSFPQKSSFPHLDILREISSVNSVYLLYHQDSGHQT